jgi:3-oxoadipate enol-lactonase / 4-carboxymuconolactone decarboxylase
VSVALHHVVDGPADGPVLVLGPSLGSTLAMWDAQAAALAGRYRVVRYDLRGHGGSPVPSGPYSLADIGGDVLALLDALGIERAHVGGLSLGGCVAMWIAANAPERVDRLALVCTTPGFPDPAMWEERAATARQQGTEALADATIERWLTPAFAQRETALAATLRAMVAGTPDEGYAGCCAALGAMDLEPVLGQIRAPALVIAGDDDPSTPPDHAVRIARGIPGARMVVLHARHMAAIERAGAVTALLLEHLEEDRHAAGMRVRRAVLGDAHVDRAAERTTPFSAPFQEYITRAAWGDVWTRPGLDRRTRSCLTLALLTALRATDELPMHVRAAIRNGLTPDEIGEVLLHAAVYAGVPAANSAFAVAQKTLAELDP